VPTSAPSSSAGAPLLQVSGLTAGYGKIVVLRDISLAIGAGEAVALLGPNGAGKTTLLRALSGLLPRSGQVRFAGRDMPANPRETVAAGMAHVVEGHRVFTQLSVHDNLLLAGYGLMSDVRARQVEAALSFFPEIAEKRNDRAVTLSGGQQQMLAVAQGLVGRPRLLMLDEPSAGLSPVLVDRVLAAVAQLRASGRRWRWSTVFMRWPAARSCSRREPTRLTCRTGSSAPTSAKAPTRRWMHSHRIFRHRIQMHR